MPPRKGAHTVTREELCFIEQSAKQTLHAMPPQEREKMPLSHSRLLPARDELRQVRPIIQVPFKPVMKLRKLLQQLRFQCLHSEQWYQPHEGPYLERHHRGGRQVQNVIIELIFLVPKAYPA